MKERTIEETLTYIEKITKNIKVQQNQMTEDAQDNPEGLSLGLLELGRLNSSLGRHAAYAEYIARNADRAARRFRADRTLELAKSMAVNKAEKQAELDSEEVFSAASYAQLVADQAKDLSYRTDSFAKFAQSRLSLIKSDISRG
jgi:hypothetical protein